MKRQLIAWSLVHFEDSKLSRYSWTKNTTKTHILTQKDYNQATTIQQTGSLGGELPDPSEKRAMHQNPETKTKTQYFPHA